MTPPTKGMDSHTLMLAFLRPAGDDPIVNRLTAAISKHGMCHAKLVFPSTGHTTLLGFSIRAGEGETACFAPTELSNPNYECVTLSVSPAEHARVYNFCREVSQRAMGFDNIGMYLSAVHPGGCQARSSGQVGTTFCSKIVTEALQQGGIDDVEGLCGSRMSPSSLYEAVRDSPRRVVTPLRMRCARRLAMS